MTDRRLTFTDGHPDPEWLGALHDGELTTAEAREVEAHAVDCAACRQRLAEFAELSELTPRLEPPLPGPAYWPGLTDRILARVDEAHDDVAPHATAAGANRPAAVSTEAGPWAALRPGDQAGRRPAWRWLVPLAAVCGVALLSWRLLLSRPSLMGEVGNPRPEYRSRSLPAESNPAPAENRARDSAQESYEAPGPLAGQPARKDEPRLESAEPAATPAPRQVTRSKPTAQLAAGQVNSGQAASGPAGSAASTPGPLSAPPPAPLAKSEAAATLGATAGELNERRADQDLRGGAGARLGEAPLPLDQYRARLAAGVPLDSVLAESGREVEALCARLRPGEADDRGAATRDPGAPATQSPARPAAPSAVTAAGPMAAAPPDSLTLARATAIEEARLLLLKELRPTVDRREIEARLAWLRKIWKKQGL